MLRNADDSDQLILDHGRASPSALQANERLVQELQAALENVRTLEGIALARSQRAGALSRVLATRSALLEQMTSDSCSGPIGNA